MTASDVHLFLLYHIHYYFMYSIKFFFEYTGLEIIEYCRKGHVGQEILVYRRYPS